MRSFLRRKHYRISTWLGMFGAASPKPLKLWSSGKFVAKLKRTAMHCLTFLCFYHRIQKNNEQLPCRKLVRSKFEKKDMLIDRYQDSTGRWRFKGNKALKGSQTYPAPFGREAFHGGCRVHGSIGYIAHAWRFSQTGWPLSIFQPCAGATALGSLCSLPRNRVGRRSHRPMGRCKATWQPHMGILHFPFIIK